MRADSEMPASESLRFLDSRNSALGLALEVGVSQRLHVGVGEMEIDSVGEGLRDRVGEGDCETVSVGVGECDRVPDGDCECVGHGVGSGERETLGGGMQAKGERSKVSSRQPIEKAVQRWTAGIWEYSSFPNLTPIDIRIHLKFSVAFNWIL
jgi:hypothetical protein